jgi:hypothetical protein
MEHAEDDVPLDTEAGAAGGLPPVGDADDPIVTY